LDFLNTGEEFFGFRFQIAESFVEANEPTITEQVRIFIGSVSGRTGPAQTTPQKRDTPNPPWRDCGAKPSSPRDIRDGLGLALLEFPNFFLNRAGEMKGR
jgi:hypothetical protein